MVIICFQIVSSGFTAVTCITKKAGPPVESRDHVKNIPHGIFSCFPYRKCPALEDEWEEKETGNASGNAPF